MERIRVLLVDDDVILGPIICDYLETKGMKVTLLHASTNALLELNNKSYDICILDVKMPRKSGFELAKEIYELHPNLPFIFLTGEANKSDKIEGLTIGADDYITKPFNIEELFLRIKAVLKRSNNTENSNTIIRSQYNIGQYIFTPNLRLLVIKGAERQLSTIETQLLQLFCVSNDGTIDRDTALKKIWQDEFMLKSRSLNVYVSKLREYLKGDSNIEILNIHGKGYSLIVKQTT